MNPKTGKLLTLIVAGFAFSTGSVAFAQSTTTTTTTTTTTSGTAVPVQTATAASSTAPATKTDDDVVQMAAYTVAGSYIPYAADAPAVPVQTIGLDQIKATGESGDLLQVLRKTVPQFVGNGNLGSSNGNIASNSTNGGSQVKLRNVQTLILINGRRAVFAPVNASGGLTFVDVNAIPVSAVERIEVLSDGASATYGSDAVSGVVNIILKKDFQGLEVGGGYSVATQKGHWEERTANFTVGAKSGNTSITVSGEWVKSDPMYQNERAFSSNQTGKTSNIPGFVQVGSNVYFAVPGKIPPLNSNLTPDQLVAQGYFTGPVAPSVAPSTFNLAPYVTLMVGSEKMAGTVNLEHKFTDSISAFGDILYSKTETFSQLAAQPIIGMPSGANFASGSSATADNPQNPFDTIARPRNRFVDDPRQYDTTTYTLRALGGLRGQINEYYSWEGAVNYNRADQDYINRNVINRTAMAAAVNSGLVNMFANGQDAASLTQAGIFGIATANNVSTLVTADLRLNGEIPNLLPAGSLKFAVGAETRRETLSSAPDAGSYTITDPTNPLFGQPAMWDGATTSSPFDANRTVNAVFLEVRIPLFSPEQKIPGLYTADIDAAVRYENYSDTEDPTVPKITLRYLPFNDQFAIRGSYAKSFTAPDLYSLFGPAGVGFTNDVVNLQRAGGGEIDDVGQATLRDTSFSGLKPERATTWSAGVVFSPKKIKGLVVDLNYFNIKQTNLVGRQSDQDIIQDVETNGAASKYADRVRIGGFNGTPITAPGQISAIYDANGIIESVYETNPLENIATASQDGVDFHVAYDFQTKAGNFDTQFNATWYHSYKVDGEEQVGTTDGQSVLNGGTIPRYHLNFLANWELNGFLASFGAEFIPTVEDTIGNVQIASYQTFDLSVGYRFRKGYLNGLTVRVGVNNIFDRMPPAAPDAWPDAGADTTTYGMLGRVIYVNASWKF